MYDATTIVQMEEEQAAIDVVLTVGELDASIEALREFLHATSALEAQGMVDRGDDVPPALVTVGRAMPIEVVDGTRTVHLPHAVELDVKPKPEFTHVPQLPPFDVDAAEATVTGALGGLPALAEAVEQLAEYLGGRSVALAFFPSTDPEMPVALAARRGEQTILSLGEEQFTLPS
jgi:hypothetical protein